MEKKEYPKWVYHADQGSKLVKDAQSHQSLLGHWHESPVEAASADLVEVESAPKKRSKKAKAEE